MTPRTHDGRTDGRTDGRAGGRAYGRALWTSRQVLPTKHGVFTHCCFNVGPLSSTLAQDRSSIGWMPRVFWVSTQQFVINVWAVPSVSTYSMNQALFVRLFSYLMPWSKWQNITQHNKYTFFISSMCVLTSFNMCYMRERESAVEM